MPTLIAASDIIDLNTAIGANDDVYQSTIRRHDRAHSITSSLDHSNVTGTPSANNVLGYLTSNNKWQPVALVIVADGGTR